MSIQRRAKSKEGWNEFSVVEIDWNIVYEELHLKEEKGLIKGSRSIRKLMLEESQTWPRGNLHNFSHEVPSVVHEIHEQIHTIVYEADGLETGVYAPGKEASNNSTTKSYVGDRGPKPNHNDMLPVITKNGQRLDDVDLTFGQMFDLIGRGRTLSEEGLLILAAMFYRNGFCLDHEIRDGRVILEIPKYSLQILKKTLGQIGDIPIETFIYFMDILALNEDAKVHALGREKFERYGRTNTLLTFSHVISVLLGTVSLAKLCGSFARPPSGMAPITDKDARSAIFGHISILADSMSRP